MSIVVGSKVTKNDDITVPKVVYTVSAVDNDSVMGKAEGVDVEENLGLTTGLTLVESIGGKRSKKGGAASTGSSSGSKSGLSLFGVGGKKSKKGGAASTGSSSGSKSALSLFGGKKSKKNGGKKSQKGGKFGSGSVKAHSGSVSGGRRTRAKGRK